MKNLKLMLVMAVIFLGLGFSAYASDNGINDITTGAININTATAQELSMLPFVNRQTAENIVSYRDSNGSFSEIDELKNVKGVSRTLLDDLRSHLKLDGLSDFDPYVVH